MVVPVAGSMMSIVAPSSDGTSSPSMTWPNNGRPTSRAVALAMG